MDAIKKFVDTEENNMDKDSSDALDVLDRLTGSVEGPEDRAVQHDHYLYGTPKSRHGQRQDQAEWLQVGSGEPFGPYDAVKLKGDGPSFSEMIVEDRNQA